MRIALALTLLALIAAAPAAAQEKSRFVVVKPQPAAAAPLRGLQPAPQPSRPASPLSPTPPEEPALADPIGGAASVKWVTPKDAGAARQCSSRCDSGYYACLSGDEDPQSCSPSWGQCRSKCERTKRKG